MAHLGSGSLGKIALSALVLTTAAGCSTLSPPFDKMKDSQMTVYRLQNFEPPAAQAQASTGAGFQLPAQIQQWIQAGASLLPPGLLPPGLIPGSAPAAQPATDAPRFYNFRILAWQPVNDTGARSDILDVFGHSSSFQNPSESCVYAEFGFAMAGADGSHADILTSLSCGTVQANGFNWPYPQTGLTPDASKKIASIAQRVFQGR
jgi:hypothetical protein